jgi:hypothetical protein
VPEESEWRTSFYGQEEAALKVAVQPELARYTLNDGPKTQYRDNPWSSLELLLFDLASNNEPAIMRHRALSSHAISWMTLSRDRPLEAHLRRSVVQ